MSFTTQILESFVETVTTNPEFFSFQVRQDLVRSIQQLSSDPKELSQYIAEWIKKEENKVIQAEFQKSLKKRLQSNLRFVNTSKESTIQPENLAQDYNKIIIDALLLEQDPANKEPIPASESTETKSVSRKPLKWVENNKYIDYKYQWEIFVIFSGENFEALNIFRLLTLLVESFELISGVSVELESQGMGSWWYKFKVYIKDIWQKEETKQILTKTREAIVSDQLDKPIQISKKLEEEALKTKAERESVERQNESLPNSEEAIILRKLQIRAREADIESKELENKSKKLENRRKELEIFKQEMEISERIASMIRDGMVNSSPVRIEINGELFLEHQNGNFLSGVNINEIDNMTAVKPSEHNTVE